MDWKLGRHLQPGLSHWPLGAAGMLGQVQQPCSDAQGGSQGSWGEPSTLERLAGSSCIWELTPAPADVAVTEHVRSVRQVLGEFMFSECVAVSVHEVLISLSDGEIQDCNFHFLPFKEQARDLCQVPAFRGFSPFCLGPCPPATSPPLLRQPPPHSCSLPR